MGRILVTGASDFLNDGCEGCKISSGQRDTIGKLSISLSGNWVLNHYNDYQQGFLGWLILQPYYHRMEWSDLTTEEAMTLGTNICKIDNTLRRYWEINFKDDTIKRLYVTYFHEGIFDMPKQNPYHLHIHLIPRTKKIGLLLQEEADGITMVNAWRIYESTEKPNFPTEYRIRRFDGERAYHLMTFLRDNLVS